MKKTILIVAVFLICATSFAQILKPVKWSYASKRINDNEAIVFIKATMKKLPFYLTIIPGFILLYLGLKEHAADSKLFLARIN